MWGLQGWGPSRLTAVPAPLSSPHTGFLDWVPKKMQRVGCVELLNTVQRRVQPRLHVFGHIHEGRRGGGEGLLRGSVEGTPRLPPTRSPPPCSQPLPDVRSCTRFVCTWPSVGYR